MQCSMSVHVDATDEAEAVENLVEVAAGLVGQDRAGDLGVASLEASGDGFVACLVGDSLVLGEIALAVGAIIPS